MREVVGVVAEFNPFHDGHAYLLERAKKLSGAIFAVCAMSGDYVQRGEPAVMSKYARAEEALRRGADVVLSPSVYSTLSAAGEFAKAYISLLLHAGADAIAFGCEDPDIVKMLPFIKGHILPSGSVVESWTRAYMRMGDSYPLAREKALIETCNMPQKYIEMIRTPNNLLVYEYMKSLCELGAADKVTLIPIKREGMAHDADEPNEDDDVSEDKNFASASFIRKRIFSGEASYPYIEAYGENYRFVSWESLEEQLYYKLLFTSREELSRVKDVGDDLAGRILSEFRSFDGPEAFLAELKNKSVTRARLSRVLMQILLGLNKRESRPSYAQLIGYRRDASELLRAMKKSGELPLITRTSDAKKLLDAKNLDFYGMDVRANALYARVASRADTEPLAPDYAHPPVVV